MQSLDVSKSILFENSKFEVHYLQTNTGGITVSALATMTGPMAALPAADMVLNVHACAGGRINAQQLRARRYVSIFSTAEPRCASHSIYTWRGEGGLKVECCNVGTAGALTSPSTSPSSSSSCHSHPNLDSSEP